MQIRFQNSSEETMQMSTASFRENFLITNLFQDDTLQLVYSDYDRVIIGGVKPIHKTVKMSNHSELKADFFLQRREMGIINVGGAGIIRTENKEYAVDKLGCVYFGKGTREVKFKSKSKNDTALFYLLSAPAHHKYPNN